MTTRTFILMSLLAGHAAGCGSDASSNPPPSGGGGAGGSAGTAGTNGELCTKACAVTSTCDAKADIDACATQCEKEVAGQGYLQSHVAVDYFKQFAALQNDADCLYSKGGYAWWWWTTNPDRIDQLPDQDVMQECKDVWLACVGPTGTQDGFREACFLTYYRYNTDIRGKVKSCFSVKCSPTQPDACVVAAQPPDEPWLAGVEQANPPI